MAQRKNHGCGISGCVLYLLVLLAAIPAGIFAIINISADSAVGTESSLLLDVDRSGSGVKGDEVLIETMTGDVELPESTVEGSACRNLQDWVKDIALDTDSIVATRVDLIRAAELIATGEVDLSVVSAVEARFWEFGRIDPRTDWTEQGIDPSLAADYIGRRSQQPGPDAARRFVVYSSSITTRRQRIFYVDLDQFAPAEMRGIGRIKTLDPIVAGPDGADVYEFDARRCEDFEGTES